MFIAPEALKDRFAASLLALLLLVFFHPYSGIRHDAILYLGQALLKGDPENFGGDLFFAFGGQTSFTVFPDLISMLLKHFDASIVFEAMAATGLIIFALASWFLLRIIFPAQTCYYGLLALLVLPSGYGANNIFSYAEPFFTGRSLSEPLVLLALAFYLKKFLKVAVLIWLAALLIHPLQAIPLLTVTWCGVVLKDRRWLFLMLGPLFFLAIGYLGVPFVDRLVIPFGTDWYEAIREPNQHVFLMSWRFFDWTFLLVDFFVLALAYRRLPESMRGIPLVILMAMFISFLASFLVADVMHLAFLTGVQLWRVQWLGHWLAVACVPYLLGLEYKSDGVKSVPFWLLLIIVILGAPATQTAVSAWAVWIAIPLFVIWGKLESQIGKPVRYALLFSLPCVLLLMMAKYGLYAHGRYVGSGGDRSVLRPEILILSHPLVAATLILCGVYLYKKFAGWRVLALIALLILVGGSFDQWDRRNLWTRYVESAHAEDQKFGVELEPGAQVFWVDELLAPWLILHRPSFFNNAQMAGLLFSHATAQEAVRREKIVAPLDLQVNVCHLLNNLNKTDQTCVVDVGALRNVCQSAAGQLNYLVLTNPVTIPPAGYWSVGPVLKDGKDVTYYMYDCRDLI